MKRIWVDEDDESDDFITIGTPLAQYDEDEVPVRKPVALQDQTVRDTQGRLRFHGAFTGGFSAGYFNTVDTKEGWAPQSFKSSRSQKAEVPLRQRPEDFMDDEDFGEFGVAPKRVSTTKNFTDSASDRKHKAVGSSNHSNDLLLGSSLLTDLIRPCRSSMGVRLLRKLGWKDSQGIGPRLRKRKRLHLGKSNLCESERTEPTDAGQRVYGCTLPPGLLRRAGGGESDGRSGDDDDDDDDVHGLDGITFAPHDVCPINFDPKDNVHGLGYRGIDPTTALFHGNRLEPVPVKSKGRLGIRGQAFGVGAFEEEDDDIYGVETMTNYDVEIGNDDQKEGSTFGWTAPKHHAKEKRSFEEITRNKDVLDGFRHGSTPVKPKTNFPPPQLPRDFRPFHKFESSSTSAERESAVRSTDDAKMNAFRRGELLGERPHLRSVFELVSTEDRAKMEAAKMQQQQQQPTAAVPHKEPPVPAVTRFHGTASSKDAETEKKASGSDELKKSDGFLPFARDPLKQKRYEAYLEAMKHNRPYVHDETAGGHMTEWEKEREKEEFAKAAHLFQPLSNMIASRFTRAKHDDDDTNVELPAEKEKSAQVKAAEMKMFGKLTRQRCEWHPDKMVCRRFNIADPYPESTIVGLRTAKREKCSIFNFLTFPSQAEEEPDMETEIQPVRSESQAKPLKPLAILASIDLRPKVRQSSDAATDAVNAPESSATGASAEETDADVAEDVDRRPPIDLFKAIFEDADSSESSSDESPNDGAAEKEISSDPVVPTEAQNPVQETTENFVAVIPQPTTSFETESEIETHLKPNEISSSSKVVADNTVISEVFGPALPPATAVNSFADQSENDRRSISENRKDKRRHKSKHKHKMKKSSSKKQKHKKKHRKKASKPVSSQSSGSDTDYNADSDSASDIDQRLMSKLKGYVEGQGKGSAVKRKK